MLVGKVCVSFVHLAYFKQVSNRTTKDSKSLRTWVTHSWCRGTTQMVGTWINVWKQGALGGYIVVFCLIMLFPSLALLEWSLVINKMNPQTISYTQWWGNWQRIGRWGPFNSNTYWPVYQYVPDNPYLVYLLCNLCIVVTVNLGKHTDIPWLWAWVCS